MLYCESLIPGTPCEKPVETEFFFAGGKRAKYCLECANAVRATMELLNGESGKVKYARRMEGQK